MKKTLAVAGLMLAGALAGRFVMPPERAAQGNAPQFIFADGGVLDVSQGPQVMRVPEPKARPDGGTAKQADLFRFGGLMCDRALLRAGKKPAEACWYR